MKSRMSKQRLLCISSFIYIFTLLFDLPLMLVWLKYVALALAMFWLGDIGITRCKFTRHRGIKGLRWLTLVILCAYIILCLDTFMFHARLPLPPMITYTLFDFYLPLSVLFLLDGMLYAYANK